MAGTPTRLCNPALVMPVPWPRHRHCHSSYKQPTENQNTRYYPVDAEGIGPEHLMKHHHTAQAGYRSKLPIVDKA